MTENETQGGDEFTADEKAFFETGGETALTQEPDNAQGQEGLQAEAETVTADADEKENGERDEKGRFVPHGALHAERERRKEIESQYQTILQKHAVLEDRWNSILKAQEQRQEPQTGDEDPMPDPNKDIFAHSAWQARQIERLKEDQAKKWGEFEQTRQQQQEEQAILQEWTSSVQQFQTQKPDFGDAAQYLSDLRAKQLSALGLDQNGINATINQELKGVIQQAKQVGKSPAELIYQYASVSGYAPKQVQQQNTAELPDSLKRVAQAQEQAKTLANGGGKGGSDPDSPEAIASMSEREFEAWMSKPENARRFERMMGA